jgi:hypothetical protein
MNYNSLLQAIEGVHYNSKAESAGAINRLHVLRNWLIGAYLVEYEQKGQDRADYGVGLLKKVATDLRKKNVSGCSKQMLERMRLLFRNYPQLSATISSAPLRKLPDFLQKNDLPKSSSPMRISAEAATPIPQALPAQLVLRLSWTHLIEIIAIEDPWKRAFFENECLKGNWSVRQLQRQKRYP